MPPTEPMAGTANLTVAIAQSVPVPHDLDRSVESHVVLAFASSDGLHIGALSFVPHAGVMTYLKEYPHHSEAIAFAPGRGGDLLDVSDQNVALAICADLTHPEHAQAAVQAGATMYAASCFLTESGYAKDADLLKRYATEYGIVVIMANYGTPMGEWSSAGRSAIWSGDGSLIACAPPTGAALVIATRSSDGWAGYVVEVPVRRINGDLTLRVV